MPTIAEAKSHRKIACSSFTGQADDVGCGFIHLLHLRVGLQPKPQLPSVERTPPRGLFAVTTPRPGCNVSHSVHFGQAQDLASSLILFLTVNIIAGLLKDQGPEHVLPVA